MTTDILIYQPFSHNNRIPHHPTTVCSVATEFYFQWVATYKAGQSAEDKQAARRAYEAHVSRCKICRGEA